MIYQDRRRIVPAALVCSVLANINRNERKRPQPFTIADFMPDPDAQTDEEHLAEFAERVRRGDKFTTAPADMRSLKEMFESMKNVKVNGK